MPIHELKRIVVASSPRPTRSAVLATTMLCILVAACNCGPSVTSDSPNGVYRLTRSTVDNTCVPPPCEGDAGIAALTSTLDGSVNVPLSHCFGGKREWGTTRHLAPSQYSLRDACGLIIGRESLAIEQLGPPLVVRVTTVLDAGECSLDGGTASSTAWPASACHAEQRYTFDLLEDCQPPCTLMSTSPSFDVYTCRCP